MQLGNPMSGWVSSWDPVAGSEVMVPVDETHVIESLSELGWLREVLEETCKDYKQSRNSGMTEAPVERTTRYATSVDDLPAAWAFVMRYLDKVGPNPSVEITPCWVIQDPDGTIPRRFEVVVSGMVHDE